MLNTIVFGSWFARGDINQLSAGKKVADVNLR
jgi:hypothetical protein